MADTKNWIELLERRELEAQALEALETLSSSVAAELQLDAGRDPGDLAGPLSDATDLDLVSRSPRR